MTLWSLFIAILIFCLIVWLTRSYLPPPFNPWVIIVCAGLLIIWLIASAGFLTGLGLNTPIRVR